MTQPTFDGTEPELIVLSELLRRRLIPGVDFEFQSRRLGGRVEKGGLVLDFLFQNPPLLAINVQGVYYHYEQGAEVRARDQIARQVLAGQGITLIFIDEDDILENARFYVGEALQYRDHSRIGGR